MTISEQLACEAKGLNFRDLPPEVIHQVKRIVLDIVGVGIGGYLSEPSYSMSPGSDQGKFLI